MMSECNAIPCPTISEEQILRWDENKNVKLNLEYIINAWIFFMLLLDYIESSKAASMAATDQEFN